MLDLFLRDMQTKKRISGRTASREHGCSRVSRSQKKALENVKVAEKKMSELITSSARKQRCAEAPIEKSEETIVAATFTSICDMVHKEVSDAPSWSNAIRPENSVDGDSQCQLETIFSPPFHLSKTAGGETPNEEEKKYKIDVQVEASMFLKKSDQHLCSYEMLSADTNAVDSRCDSSEGAGLSTEVSAIYLAMKNSKLECVNECGRDYDSIQTDAYLEDDEYEDFEDFDPYLFIKNLPALSSVVPTYRRMLLPRQTRSCPRTTLVLDLDETLVHSSLEPCHDADFTFSVKFNLQQHLVYVRCRPHLYDFMERVSSLFEIILFTASQSIYAEQLLNVLDPKRKIFRHRVYRDSCVFVDGNYLKDLSVLGRDLARVIIVDNSPQAFGFQVDNGIPIESWFDDPLDQELLSLLPFLESLVGVEDVRPLIAKRYKLREKIAAAVCPPLYPNKVENAFE